MKRIFIPSVPKSYLIGEIRKSSGRQILINNVKATNVDGKVTVLSLSAGKENLGVLKTRNAREAKAIKKATAVAFTIGWDKNRNEVINTSFV